MMKPADSALGRSVTVAVTADVSTFFLGFRLPFCHR